MNLEDFQQLMRKMADDDKKNRHVTVTAETLPEALHKAAIELGLKTVQLQYEVIQVGTTGVFGVGKKPFILMAYPEHKAVEEIEESSFDFNFDASVRGKDGCAYVHRSRDGILLKVTAPENGGAKCSEHDAIQAIEQKFHEDYNASIVSKVVKHADGEWVKIADFEHNPNQDAEINVELAEMEMKAFIRIKRPGQHGADLSMDGIRSILEMNNVNEGYLDETLLQLENHAVYEESILVAEGQKPQNGADAKVIYTFETENKIHLKEIDGGKVDFKELNNINNVVEGQILAKLVPPGKGVPGRTVTGKYLPAKDGKDAELVVGQNVRVSDDKKQAIAATNGQVIVQNGKISVEPIYMVEGDVSLKTGNILFLGSVEVMGNVEDGFNVKAAGNIEIHGTVGKCVLDAEGDIIVHAGITGRNEAQISAGGNIWSKFIENASAEAGGLVFISEGIVNSHITCDHKIICRGKRANVVGGKLVASEEIDAKTLGSIAGAETVLEVGFDPKTKAQLDAADAKLKTLEKESADVDLNLASLEKMVKAKKDITEEKKAFYVNLQTRELQLRGEIATIKDEIGSLNKYLDELKNNGRISASDKVFPGVKIFIKDAYHEVRNEMKRVTYVVESGVVKVTKYEESSEDISVPKTVRKK